MTAPLTPERLEELGALCERTTPEQRRIRYHQLEKGDWMADIRPMPDVAQMLKDGSDALVALPDALAEIRRLREERQWQPIATAPKDGTWLMVINAEAQEPKPWFVRMKRGAWVNQKNMVVEPTFTHWQPLPPPPAREGSEG